MRWFWKSFFYRGAGGIRLNAGPVEHTGTIASVRALLCRKHHKIVDNAVDEFPPALLTEMKRAHEAHPKGRVDISDAMVQRLVELLSTQPATPAAPAFSVTGSVQRDFTFEIP